MTQGRSGGLGELWLIWYLQGSFQGSQLGDVYIHLLL